MTTPTMRAALLGGAFVPQSLPGCVVFLDADNPATLYTDSALTTPVAADGDPVGGWRDLSVQRNNALQATAAKRPLWKTGANGINGRGVLRFDGTDDFIRYTLPAALPQPYTYFMVMTLQATLPIGGVFYVFDAASATYVVLNSSQKHSFYAGVHLQAAALDNAPHVHICRGDGTSSVVTTAGVSVNGNAGAGAWGVTNTIGAASTGTANAQVDVAMLGFYNRRLTAPELAGLARYLTNRYGLPA